MVLASSGVSAQENNVRRNTKPAKPATTTPSKPKPTKPSTTTQSKPKPTPQSKPQPQQNNNAGRANSNNPTTPSNPKPQPIVGCPDGNHPHMIDLGLPSGTKWACCNVDASKPDDFGGYYAWGETTTKSDYSWRTYKHCNGIQESCHNLGSSICGTQYDVAHVKWGGSWQMPTKDQIVELTDKCKHEWITVNGVDGRRFIGPNGHSIFLPAAGYRSNSDDLFRLGTWGFYWSGTQYTNYSYDANNLLFYSNNVNRDDYSLRRCGYCVRPVSR